MGWFSPGSKASQSTAVSTTTNNSFVDRRLALGENARAISGDRNVLDDSETTIIDWNTTDNSVMSDYGAVTGALDAIATSNVMQGATLERLALSNNQNAAQLVAGSNESARALISGNNASLGTLAGLAQSLVNSVVGSSRDQQQATVRSTENALDAVGSAYSKSLVDSKGSLEQKTIVIIAIAAAAAFAFWTRRGRA